MLKTFTLKTREHSEMVEITDQIEDWLVNQQINNAVILVSSMHTTAGITVNENADPDVKTDFLRRLDEVYPWYHPNDQHMEGNTAAHLKTSTVGHAQPIIVSEGKLVLGVWQGIYFCEFDGPRTRKFVVKVISES